MFSVLSRSLFPAVLDLTLTGSLVIAAVLVIRLALRRAPARWRYLLWLVVAFRLICPVSLSAPVSLLGALRAPVTTAGTIQYVPRPALTPQIQPSLPDFPAISPTIPIPAQPVPVSASGGLSALEIFSLLWLAGVAVLLCYSVIRLVRLRRELVGAIRMEGRVWQSDRVGSPFILGLFRPRIYLPFGLDPDMQEAVLAHEGHHLRRGDHIVKPLAFLLLCLHWFNPLCWLAFVLMGRDMEMSCDEWVLAHRDGDARVYSTALLSFAANRRMPVPGPLAFSESEVRPRIVNTLRWKRPRLWVTLAAGAACAVVLLLCALNPKRPPLPSPFGSTYRAVSLAYNAPMYSFVLDPATVHFTLNDLGSIEASAEGRELSAHFGQTVELTEENFDACFSPQGWAEGCDAETLRRENKTAWYLEAKDMGEMPVFCYLMQQTNGDLYLAFGYRDLPDEANGGELPPSIRWLMKVEPDELISVTVHCRDGFVHTVYPVWYPQDEYHYLSVNAGSIHAEGAIRLQTSLPHHTFTLHETMGSDEYSYALTTDSTGLTVLPISRINLSGKPTIAEYRLESAGGYYTFHVDFAAQVHIYANEEDYVAHVMDTIEQEQYTVYTENGINTRTAPVAETRRAFLHRNAQLAGLTGDGSLLEAWSYGIDIRLDLPGDPDRYSYAGGVYQQDGWWVDLYPARNLILRRGADGRCRILSDEPINDGFDFLMGLNDYEKALYDWYVKEYDLTDSHPPYAIYLLTYYSTNIGYRYDGDGWYLYAHHPWKMAEDGRVDHWVSGYDTGSYLKVERSEKTLDSLVRQLQDAGWQNAEQEITCMIGPDSERCIYPDKNRGGCWIVHYAQGTPPPEQTGLQPDQELEELRQMARHFRVL